MNSQKAVSQVLLIVDNNLWQAVSLKKLNEFPRYKLQKESNMMFTDIAVMATQTAKQSNRNLTTLTEVPVLQRQNFNTGQIKTTKKAQSHFPRIDNYQQPPLKTNTTLNTKTSVCIKLGCIQNEEEQNQIAILRNRIQLQREEQLERQTQLHKYYQEEKHKNTLKEKIIKEGKHILYDYDGNILTGENNHFKQIDVLNIKSALAIKKNANILKMKQGEKKYKMLQNTKRVSSQTSQMVCENQTSKFLNLFNEKKILSRGVKIIQLETNQSVSRQSKNQQITNLTLKQFKKYSQHRRPRTYTTINKEQSQLDKISMQTILNPISHLEKEQQSSRWKTISMAESRSKRKTGCISVNNDSLYNMNFKKL